MSIGAETVAVMSPGCVTVAVTTGETVSIGVETVAVMSPGCVTVLLLVKQCQLEQKLLL